MDHVVIIIVNRGCIYKGELVFVQMFTYLLESQAYVGSVPTINTNRGLKCGNYK